MKTYVKKVPFPEHSTEAGEFVSLTLSEEETFWVYAEDHTCHPYMMGLINKKLLEAHKRYKKPVRVFDTHGVVVQEIS